MWHLLPWRIQLRAIVLAAAALFSLFNVVENWLNHEPSSPWHLAYLAVAIIGFVIVPLVGFFWRRVWKLIPWLDRNFFPDCAGIWEGVVISTFRDPVTGARKEPIPAIFWIRQNLFATSVRSLTGESPGYSIHCWLESDSVANRFLLRYVYENIPRASVRDRSPRHEGTATLTVDQSAKVRRITGAYYTDRETSGEIRIERTHPNPDDPKGPATPASSTHA